MDTPASTTESNDLARRLFPFSKRNIARRIERISIAVRTGNNDEVNQIMSAIRNRKQTLSAGFDHFITTSSDLTILKALEPIILNVKYKDLHDLKRILIKNSKLPLVLACVEKSRRILQISDEESPLHLSLFIDLFNNFPLENFYDAIDYFTSNKMQISRPEHIFVATKALMMSDFEIQEFIRQLSVRGIQVQIRKTKEEIMEDSESEIQYRNLILSDYNRTNWYTQLNQAEWIGDLRHFYQIRHSGQTKEILDTVRAVLKFNRGTERIIPELIQSIKNGDLPLETVNQILSEIFKNKKQLSTELFLQWSEFVFQLKEEECLSVLVEIANSAPNIIHNPFLKLDGPSVEEFLEKREWKDLARCLEFIQFLSRMQNGSRPTGSAFGYFLLNCDFLTEPLSIRSFERELGRDITEKEFSLGISSFEDKFESKRILEYIEFGKERKLINEEIILKIYKVALLNLSPDLLEFLGVNFSLSPLSKAKIRHTLLEFELSSGNLLAGTQLFKMTADFLDQDKFDSVILIQNCPFEVLPMIENLIRDYLPKGLPFDERSVGSLCNRYSRNNCYLDVLRVLDNYQDLEFEDDTILKLYRLAALSNLGDEAKARVILNELIAQNNQFLIQKYAPSILKKIGDAKITSLAKALSFELKNTTREYSTKKYTETSLGIVRNRNLPKEIKELYDSVCQVCQVSLDSPFGRLAEAAHIQALGHPHYGSDDLSNLLCLCPNHHKQFDSSGWYLSDSLEIIETISHKVMGMLNVLSGHEISSMSVTYQRNYAINASNKGQRIWKNVITKV